MKKDPSMFCDSREFTNLQNIIGVSADEIRSYIQQKEDKEKNASVKKDIKKSFSHRLISKLTNIELKKVLQTMKVSWTRQQDNRADLLIKVDQELKSRKMNDEDLFDEQT